MKIRNDFVTNSSSSSTTEVIVDNPVLLTILQKYKDMGLFGGQEKYEGVGLFGDNATIGIGNYGNNYQANSVSRDYPNYPNTPAFFFSGRQSDEYSDEYIGDGFDPPKSLDGVLGSILYVLNCAEEYLDGQILEKLSAELEQRKDEINCAYSRVYWRSMTNQDAGPNYFNKFEYDPVNDCTYMWKSDETVPKSEIAVNNPVLLEILQKYKNMGLFGDNKPFFGIGELVCNDWQWGYYFGGAEGIEDEYPDLYKTPAFYYNEREEVVEYPLLRVLSTPESLDQVLDELIAIMEYGSDSLNEPVFTQLKEELHLRRNEINQAYSKVLWYREETYIFHPSTIVYDDSDYYDPVISSEFIYNIDNGEEVE